MAARRAHRLPPSHGEDMGRDRRGRQVLRLSKVSAIPVLGGHSAPLRQEPLRYRDTRLSHPRSPNQQHRKEGPREGTRLPRVTQHTNSRDRGPRKLAPMRGLRLEAQGSP